MNRSHVSFQTAVRPWMFECFGPETAADVLERNDRFIEEALELTQANGYSAERAHALVDYVFGRPAGDVGQEIGGVMVTLAALCLSVGKDMHAEAETELSRVWTKIDAIRAKQAAKPKGSALPVAECVPDISADACQFCGNDPYHRVDNGLGMEAVAIDCCEVACALWSSRNSETVEIDREDLIQIGIKLAALRRSRANAAEAERAEYERGKQHGADDLRMSQQHCQGLQRELDAAKRGSAQAKLVATGAQVALETIERIVRANLHRQTEKLDDICPIAAQAIAAIKDLAGSEVVEVGGQQ